ncbi:phosphatidylethanolamine-binding protein [Morchella snyderi]|nr:phosphatidylethanolamine-binding protein [Morchella snyderi]
MMKLARAFVFSAAFAAAYAYAKYPTSADLEIIAEKLKTAEIVPDVIPFFEPSALAYLSFDYKNGTIVALSPGARIGRNDSQIAPTISIRGLHPSMADRYVGVIVDPDAPSRETPTRRNIRHYIASDLIISTESSPDGNIITNTTAAANEYRGPNPPAGSGPHRYVFFLYRQPEGFDVSFPDLDLSVIAGFNLSAFAEKTRLGGPVAGTWFEAEVLNGTTVRVA